ncbi:SDR family NAD(P)-dependent oxidoreductase [Pseudonocardia nematodicida]|uniref:SDR family NAD(P)-dependent oxidoreductase n=1 Tax=Pseudonocardia nematodicida TaxID=1206997 RepID=A0ABV1KCK2_9PSEU
MALALITGGGTGIGAVLADRLASRGHDLLLVTRDPGAAYATAGTVAGRYGVRTDVLVADLATRHGLLRVEALLSGATAPAVDVLVHDAVAEAPGVASVHAEEQQARIDLGVTATMRLTHAALPGMLARGEGAIVVTGGSPAPADRPAAEWAQSFVAALAPTLAGTGVRARTAGSGDGYPGTIERVETLLSELDAGQCPAASGRPGLRGLSRRVLGTGARAARRGAELLADATRGPLLPTTASSPAAGATPAVPAPTAAPVPEAPSVVPTAGPRPAGSGVLPSRAPAHPRRPVPAPGCDRGPVAPAPDGVASLPEPTDPAHTDLAATALGGGSVPAPGPRPTRAHARLPDLPARPAPGRALDAATTCARSAHYLPGAARTPEQRARAAAALRDQARSRSGAAGPASR